MALKATKVKKDDVVALTYYVRVDRVVPQPGGEVGLEVTDLVNGTEINVRGKAIIEKGFSADEVDKTVEASMTETAEKLVNAGDKPFTVEFLKSDKSNRVLKGRLIAPEPLLGRSKVYEFGVKSGPPIRLVDHRTIKSLVIDGVKYVVKK